MKLLEFALISITALTPCETLIAGEEAAFTDWLVDPVDARRDRVVPLKLYVPNTDKPASVVLFSHGLGGSRNNNGYLGRYWAEAGYVAVFIQHIGSDESVWKDAAPRERLAAMQAAASARSTLDRYADIPFVIDQLEKWNAEEGNPLHGKMDLSKIGMSGHSFGAVTTQGLMGQRFPGDRTVADPRLKAFVLFSPSAHRTTSPETAFGQISKPVLCMTGTKDVSVIEKGLDPLSRQLVYKALPAGDKFQLVFENGEHHAFGDSDRPGTENQHGLLGCLSQGR
jgi:dienelactone hydrolase